jgi:L-iditol 2-dehydrogenase
MTENRHSSFGDGEILISDPRSGAVQISEEYMRVAEYHSNSDVRIKRVKRPDPDRNGILVKVMACGICGSDVMEWFRVPKSPRILGHEISGIVCESRNSSVSVGERVVVRNQTPCGVCDMCLSGNHAVCENQAEISSGGMAEYIAAPPELIQGGIFPIPKNVSFSDATLAEPISCVLNAHHRAGAEKGRSFAVFGCGAFGLLHLLIAKRVTGASFCAAIEPVGWRAQTAKELGADSVFAPIKDANNAKAVDFAIVSTGSVSAIRSAIDAVGRHGTVILFATPSPEVRTDFSFNELFWRKEIKLVSCYGAGPIPFGRALRMIEEQIIPADRILSHRLPFHDAQLGFRLASNQDEALKVVLEFT